MYDLTAVGRKALRKGRVSRPAHIYLITAITWRRRPLFTATHAARTACRAIAAPGAFGDAAVLAWVLMPDHWHGLIQLDDEPLGRVMNRFKAGLTRSLHATHAAEGRIWDRGFHDRALRASEDLRRAARYVIANPLRAGLASHALDYPYWNAVWL